MTASLRRPESEAAPLGAEARAALADDLDLLARLHDREPDAALIESLRSADVTQWFALALDGPDFAEGRRLMAMALGELPDPLDAASRDDLAADFAAIYLTYGYRAAPAESVWRDDDGLERQEAMFSVRRWYRRFGVGAPDWRKRADDHLVHQLQVLAFALRDAGNPQALAMMAAFLREHPLVWVPQFAARVVSRCRHPFFAAAALLTTAYLQRLGAMLGALLHEDMTPKPLRPGAGAHAARGPTCGDPAPAYLPGAAPGW